MLGIEDLWIKMLSSEPEADGAEAENKVSGKRDAAIDPRLEEGAKQREEDKLVDGYFSRFGTVTGKPKPLVASTGQDALSGRDGAKAYQAGTLEDEYYFSN